MQFNRAAFLYYNKETNLVFDGAGKLEGGIRGQESEVNRPCTQKLVTPSS